MSGGNSSNKGNDSNDDRGRLGSKFLKVARATLTVAKEVTAAAAITIGSVAVIGLIAGMTETEEATAVTADGLSTFLIMAGLTLGLYALRKYLSSSSKQVDAPMASSTRIRWTKPEVGWVKLNVDGSCDHISNPRSAGCGGVLRDASGNWLLGFSQKLDPSCEVHETEIAAILKGLELAYDMNIEWLVVESDNESVVSMVKNGARPNHPQYSRIRQLRSDPKWEVNVDHIRRVKANQVADRLANNARALPDEFLHKYYCPPDNCVSLVEEDARLG